ncbi:hypothetical protein VTI74DRAFT_3977 [Chaetomium olivicolor]
MPPVPSLLVRPSTRPRLVSFPHSPAGCWSSWPAARPMSSVFAVCPLPSPLGVSDHYRVRLEPRRIGSRNSSGAVCSVLPSTQAPSVFAPSSHCPVHFVSLLHHTRRCAHSPGRDTAWNRLAARGSQEDLVPHQTSRSRGTQSTQPLIILRHKALQDSRASFLRCDDRPLAYTARLLGGNDSDFCSVDHPLPFHQQGLVLSFLDRRYCLALGFLVDPRTPPAKIRGGPGHHHDNNRQERA